MSYRGIDKMLQPYGRWPFAIIDQDNKRWERSRVKGWFKYVYYDNRPDGGYNSVSKHLSHPDFIGSKFIWAKPEHYEQSKPSK